MIVGWIGRAGAIIVGTMFLATACAPGRACHPETNVQLPDERKVLGAVTNGQAGRDLAAAIFAGDADDVRRRLTRDPQLASTHVPPVAYPDFAPDGQFGDLLTFAVARCDGSMLDTLLALKVPPAIQGDALTLAIATRAHDLAEKLLAAGADANGGKGSPRVPPLVTAAEHEDVDAANLLLRHGADPNARDGADITVLQTVVDADSMQVAEALIAHGGDPWAVSAGGAIPARGIWEPLRIGSPAEEAARQRLIAKLQRKGAPWPPPDPKQVSAMVRDGAWPPAGLKP
ncbi:ankyrin repeat domain-containing protein [Sphingomonas crocodyli]|uniref:Ankyrin repeat domain-containing protein n=1 Tax=Sphingomonas crocodyli TaxID=1979270 RepID=A0A437LZR6_9SPHN|nr:ankyrin repeat domain-containing protein [Sphingomonas crocodyli]RVT90813.1 ankyrin repeat domain-containing protein [Sphingomonas crocodyli]